MSWYAPGETLIWRKRQPTGYPVLIRVEFCSYTDKRITVRLPDGRTRLLDEKEVRRPVYTVGVPERNLKEIQYAESSSP